MDCCLTCFLMGGGHVHPHILGVQVLPVEKMVPLGRAIGRVQALAIACVARDSGQTDGGRVAAPKAFGPFAAAAAAYPTTTTTTTEPHRQSQTHHRTSLS